MKIMERIYKFFSITRPLNLLIVFAAVIISGWICATVNLPVDIILLAALSASLTAAAGNVINDLFDFESDKINHPERALPSGKLNLRQVFILYYALVCTSLILSYLVNTICFAIVIISNILLFFYSNKFKSIVLFGNLIVALLTGLVFIYGGYAVGNVNLAIVPSAFAFLINFIREIVKDMHDLEGDKLEGIKTFPQVFGLSKTKVFIFILTLILIVSSFIPVLSNFYNFKYLIIITVFLNPILLFFIWSVYRNHSRENLNKLSFVLKLNMIIGLTAIYLGK